MGKADNHMRLVKYICEMASWNQTELAKRLGTSQQALNNRARRGTLQLNKLKELMVAEGIEIPKFMLASGEFGDSSPVASNAVSDEKAKALQNEVAELKERLRASEAQVTKLMEMLQLSLQR